MARKRHLTSATTMKLTNGVSTKYVSLAGAPVAKRSGGSDRFGRHRSSGLDSGADRCDGNRSAAAEVRRLWLAAADDHGPTESRGYTAQRQDETGLFYLHARYYDPALARFVSADPMASISDCSRTEPLRLRDERPHQPNGHRRVRLALAPLLGHLGNCSRRSCRSRGT